MISILDFDSKKVISINIKYCFDALEFAMSIGMSGISDTNCILSGIVKIRVEKGLIEGASILGGRGSYTVHFSGRGGEWKGKALVLCSSRDPYNPRIFKSLDGAISQLSTMGFQPPTIESKIK